MRFISLWQPWASALFATQADGMPLKAVETRHWTTDYRGRLGIHAAKRWAPDERDFAAACHRRGWLPAQLPLGALIGIVDLVGIKRTEELAETIGDIELGFGNYAAGRFGWLFSNPRPLQRPIPYRGQQGFFDVPDEVLPDGFPSAQRGMQL